MSDNRASGEKSRGLPRTARSTRRNTSEDVAHAIGRRIVRGAHPAGALLPTELELCASLGVSRPALREGLRLLAARGMIIGRRRTGTQVRPRSDWNMLDAAVLAWHLDQEPSEAYIGSLFEARMVIEPAAASLAARRADGGEIEAVAAALRQMSDAQAGGRPRSRAGNGARDRGPGVEVRSGTEGEPVTEMVAADLRFHVAILAAGGNLFLSSFGALIGSSLMAAFRLNWRAHASEPELSLAQHAAVLAAIRDGDAPRAEASMRALLESAGRDASEALARLAAEPAAADREAAMGGRPQA